MVTIFWVLALALVDVSVARIRVNTVENGGIDGLSTDEYDTMRLECDMRRLMLQKAKTLQPWRDPSPIFDALQLHTLCQDAKPVGSIGRSSVPLPPAAVETGASGEVLEIFVSATEGDDAEGDGSEGRPFASVRRALDASRAVRGSGSGSRFGFIEIILHSGIYYISSTLTLSPADSNLRIRNFPGEHPWISGGIPIPTNRTWLPSAFHGPQSDVWELDLSGSGIEDIESLFSLSPHKRLTRARFPNANVETDQWGYASLYRNRFSIPGEGVQEWTKSSLRGDVGEFIEIDLRDPENPSGSVKNDSTMINYNIWGVGRGGACASVWGDNESYWCSNISDGGWAEVDQEMAVKGMVQIPVGLTFYEDYVPPTSNLSLGQRWNDIDLTGGIIHAWHSQSWATHMFRLSSSNKNNLSFTKGSGGQGGRNWCRCDQCGYAASWCKENDTRLIGGSWYIENVIQELDSPHEWFFDKVAQTLYLKRGNESRISPEVPPNFPQLIAGSLDTILTIEGTQGNPVVNFSLVGIGIRDTSPTYMREFEWAAPSGGDWAMRKGGAITFKGAEGGGVFGCKFVRVDGNAVFLQDYTRDIWIYGSDFEWVGESAVATWGSTIKYDSTGGEQPRGSVFDRNYIHDVGLYEKQSSAWGQAKAALSIISRNIIFNLPRAGINLNDMLGGGNMIFHNLIWNTCRESGDHGPINTWDRMPFLSNIRSRILQRIQPYNTLFDWWMSRKKDTINFEPWIDWRILSSDIADMGSGEIKVPSFVPQVTEIFSNFIFANYGGSQGVDNDDGSSWYSIHRNVFYAADGFKMDYGGHDSKFFQNLIIVVPYDGQNCFNVGSFFPEHAHVFINNTCVSGVSSMTIPSGCGSVACVEEFPEKSSKISSDGEIQEIFPNLVPDYEPVSSPGQLRVGFEGPNMNIVGSAESCNQKIPGSFISNGNRYFSPNANVTLKCGDRMFSISEAQRMLNFELGSTGGFLPNPEKIVLWARRMLP